MSILDRLKDIDRRIIFVVIALSVIIPLIVRMGLSIHVSPPAKGVYDAVEVLPAGSKVIMPFDYDPSTMPELYPMSLALLRHCFSKDLKVISVALWPEGVSIAQDAFRTVGEEEFQKEYGVDYINLGYKSGGIAIISAMGRSMPAVFPTDHAGEPISKFPMMEGVRNFDDIDLIVELSAGDPGLRQWVMIAQARYHKTIGAGCTAVMAPGYYPYLQTGQIAGLLGGLKGAAEYEQLVGHPGTATRAMDPQAVAHGVIVLFIIIGNITFFALRRKPRKQG